MGGVGEDEAFVRFAGDEGRAGIATGDHVLGGFEIEVGFGFFGVVAGEAVLFEDGDDLFCEIDLGVPLELSHGKGGVE